MCMVPNCSQRLSRPILWIVAVCATYWTHIHYSNCCLSLNGSLNRLWLPTHPPPPYTCHLCYYSRCEKVAQKPAVLAIYRITTFFHEKLFLRFGIYSSWGSYFGMSCHRWSPRTICGKLCCYGWSPRTKYGCHRWSPLNYP